MASLDSMNEFLTIDSVKDVLVECPICAEYYDDTTRIPRRLPCCSQSICEPCLQIYTGGRQIVPCPLCCQDTDFKDGVASLPKEMVILRFLVLLETQSNFFPACTDCPHSNTAVGKCDTCGVLLCKDCLITHPKNTAEDHTTVTFETAKSDQQARKNTVRHLRTSLVHKTNGAQEPSDEPSEDTNELSHPLTNNLNTNGHHSPGPHDEKVQALGERVAQLHGILENIHLSKMTAEVRINKIFDDLTDAIDQRRKSVLAELDKWADQESRNLHVAIESQQMMQFKLQKAARSRRISSSSIKEEEPCDVDFVRRGVSFVENNVQQVTAAVRETGTLRTVTFRPSKRPDSLDGASHCNSVELSPARITSVPSMDQVLETESMRHGNAVICPHLEFDRSTTGENVTISGNVVVNTKPRRPLSRTGCRLQAPRTIMISRPFVPADNKRYMYAVKVNFKLKQNIPIRKAILEIASTCSPVDMNFSQVRGMSVSVASCHFHTEHKDDLCLVIETNVDRVYCNPIVPNKEGTTGEISLAILVDYGRNMIHVLDNRNMVILATVPNMMLGEPLWTMMYLGRPEWTDISGELISGQSVKVSRGLLDLISIL